MFDYRAESRRWFAQAERDLEAARHNLGGTFYETACFLSQQAAEKALKAFLYGHGHGNVTGPSVLELGRRCQAIDADFAALAGRWPRLDRLYMPTRYPDALPGGSPFEAFAVDDAEGALRDAGAILDLVRERLPNRPDPGD
ncbi:MAG: HEPN domain-containing protein [Candidatus Eremiobacterota bacterium]